MFRKIDKLRYIVRDIKDFFKDESIKVEIHNNQENLIYNNCKIIGRIGTHHLVCDITNKNITPGDIVKFNINPKYVNVHIRRNYI